MLTCAQDDGPLMWTYRRNDKPKAPCTSAFLYAEVFVTHRITVCAFSFKGLLHRMGLALGLWRMGYACVELKFQYYPFLAHPVSDFELIGLVPVRRLVMRDVWSKKSTPSRSRFLTGETPDARGEGETHGVCVYVASTTYEERRMSPKRSAMRSS